MEIALTYVKTDKAELGCQSRGGYLLLHKSSQLFSAD